MNHVISCIYDVISLTRVFLILLSRNEQTVCKKIEPSKIGLVFLCEKAFIGAVNARCVLFCPSQII